MVVASHRPHHHLPVPLAALQGLAQHKRAYDPHAIRWRNRQHTQQGSILCLLWAHVVIEPLDTMLPGLLGNLPRVAAAAVLLLLLVADAELAVDPMEG